MKELPSKTIDLLLLLKEEYEDFYETDEKKVGTPEYWKKAGVIEIIKRIENSIGHKIEK